MKKINRNVPQSVKTQRKIDEAVDKALADQRRVHGRVFDAKQDEIDRLETDLRIARESVTAALESTNNTGFLVANWKDGWKWFSNLALTAIVAINTVPVSPEMLDALPPDIRQQVTIGLGVIGILARFINQSKVKPLPPLVENEVTDDD